MKDLLIGMVVGVVTGYVLRKMEDDGKFRCLHANLHHLASKAKEEAMNLKANIISSHKGTAKIRFVNAGKSNAFNVRIEILTSKEEMAKIYYGANFGPYEVINPQSYREEKMFLCEGRPDIIDLKIIWDDEFQKDRSVLLSVPF